MDERKSKWLTDRHFV